MSLLIRTTKNKTYKNAAFPASSIFLRSSSFRLTRSCIVFISLAHWYTLVIQHKEEKTLSVSDRISDMAQNTQVHPPPLSLFTCLLSSTRKDIEEDEDAVLFDAAHHLLANCAGDPRELRLGGGTAGFRSSSSGGGNSDRTIVPPL